MPDHGGNNNHRREDNEEPADRRRIEPGEVAPIELHPTAELLFKHGAENTRAPYSFLVLLEIKAQRAPFLPHGNVE